MAGIVYSISTEVWKKRLAEYIAATGKNLGQALDEEWPLLMRKVIDFTPPFKNGGASGVSDYSVGRNAVATDIYKTMRPFDPGSVRSQSLMKVIQKRDIEAFNIIAERSNKNPLMAGSKAVAFSPLIHTSQRNARGRVTGQARPQVVLGHDAVLLRQYVSQVQSHVGFAKSGWSAAYNLVRPPDGYMLPDWISRHGSAGGGVIDDRGNVDNMSITARNWTPWAIRQDEGARIKASAYASRINAIKSKIATYLRLSRQQSGFSGHAAA